MQFSSAMGIPAETNSWRATGAFMGATKPVAAKHFSAEPRLHAKPEYEKVGDGYAVIQDLGGSRASELNWFTRMPV
jgi:hypothetical protein